MRLRQKLLDTRRHVLLRLYPFPLEDGETEGDPGTLAFMDTSTPADLPEGRRTASINDRVAEGYYEL